MYTRRQFEAKKVKRELEDEIVKTILSYGDKGCIVSLCGPAVEAHIKTLTPLLRNKSELLFAEWDQKIADRYVKPGVRKCKDKRIKFKFGNVWDCIRQRYLYKRGWDKRHVLFDLDFCATADTLVAQGLKIELKKLARSKLPRRSGFWLSITACQRNDIDSEWWQLSNQIGTIFINAGWSIRPGTRVEPYREKGRAGTSMVNMLFHFKWDNNNYNKERR